MKINIFFPIEAGRLSLTAAAESLWQFILKIWKWLLDGAAQSFWGSRLFWALAILLAMCCLISFIIIKKHSTEYKRRQVLAMDYLRDASLSEALMRKTSTKEQPVDHQATDAHLLRRPKFVRERFVLINKKSELSSREFILPAYKDITIGRADSCTIQLKDRFVAAQHCTIGLEGRKLFISTEETQQTTYLRHNRKIILLKPGQKYRLRSKDCFQTGQTRFDIIVFNCNIPGGHI